MKPLSLLPIFILFLTACSLAAPATPPPTDLPASAQPTAPDAASPPPAAGTAESASTIGGTFGVSALPTGPISLVALGDSLTQGDGDDTDRGYPARLLDMVNSLRPGSTLTNLGQSGWNSDALINGDQGIESQLTRAVQELQAASSEGRGAVALVWIGSNDLWYLYEYGGDVDAAGDAADARHFASNVDTILGQLSGAGARVIIALLDDQSKRPVALNGEAFTAITPGELARMSAQVESYNRIILEKAAQYGALTVDFYSTDIFTDPATLYEDGNHPNSAGYDLIAQKWFEALSSIL